jgi:hypothetical protein
MTGYINYLDLPLDPRLQTLLDRWTALRRGEALPAYDTESAAIFVEVRDHMTLVEIHPGPQKSGARRPRYFVISDGPEIAKELGFDLTGRYLDEIDELPEFQTMLESDYDIVRTTAKPRPYAEEHHLDNLLRRIVGIQLPFAADGRNVDHIVEITYRIDPAS